MYEDYRTFKWCRFSDGSPGRWSGLGLLAMPQSSLLEEWPIDAGPKLTTAKQILLKCLASECSAAVARVAFVEAAREADIFVEAQARPVPTGKPPRWQPTRSRRR